VAANGLPYAGKRLVESAEGWGTDVTVRGFLTWYLGALILTGGLASAEYRALQQRGAAQTGQGTAMAAAEAFPTSTRAPAGAPVPHSPPAPTPIIEAAASPPALPLPVLVKAPAIDKARAKHPYGLMATSPHHRAHPNLPHLQRLYVSAPTLATPRVTYYAYPSYRPMYVYYPYGPDYAYYMYYPQYRFYRAY
jgi:hypothetical protein